MKFARIDFDAIVTTNSHRKSIFVETRSLRSFELTLSWDFSSWVEEVEAAARRWPVWEPERISLDWAEERRCSGRGSWEEDGCDVWIDAVEVRCVRPAAAGDAGVGGGVGAGAGGGVGVGGDRLDGCTVEAVQDGRIPNEVLPHPSVAFVASFWFGGSK